MEVPARALLSTLSSQGFYVLHFQHARHKHNPKPHYWLFVPVRDDSYLCFCMFTTQHERLYEFYTKSAHAETAQASLHFVPHGTFTFLNAAKGSVIDCNNPELVTRQDMNRIVSTSVPCRLLAEGCAIPPDVRKSVVEKIRSSPRVKPFVRRLLLDP